MGLSTVKSCGCFSHAGVCACCNELQTWTFGGLQHIRRNTADMLECFDGCVALLLNCSTFTSDTCVEVVRLCYVRIVQHFCGLDNGKSFQGHGSAGQCKAH